MPVLTKQEKLTRIDGAVKSLGDILEEFSSDALYNDGFIHALGEAIDQGRTLWRKTNQEEDNPL